ncbi:RNase H domain-containing protein [Trichonephila clavipes]|nr:RNase H domain-containing protein [Trichonephila clavipes]
MPRVFFHFDLNSTANKQTHLDVHLKQLALEIISSIPKDAVQVYTDGSRTESGFYIRTPHLDTTLKQLNPDTCSIFRSEIIAINKGDDAIISYDINFGELWILSDSRSVFQHLSNWGNELADSLAKKGSEDETAIGSLLTYQELYSNERSKLNLSWRTPPVHHWYTETSPGTLLEVKWDRNSQTAFARLKSGRLKCLSFELGRKIHPTCKKCCEYPASPEHILKCVGFSKEDLTSVPHLVIDSLTVNNLMELI